eukprot:3932800-Rhodomonas_salina.1
MSKVLGVTVEHSLRAVGVYFIGTYLERVRAIRGGVRCLSLEAASDAEWSGRGRRGTRACCAPTASTCASSWTTWTACTSQWSDPSRAGWLPRVSRRRMPRTGSGFCCTTGASDLGFGR